MDHPHHKPHRIELAGEYGFAQQEELAALFSDFPQDGAAVIDLTDVTYIDSTFLNELVKLRVRLNGQPITLAGANSNVSRLLNIVHFEQLFKLTKNAL